MKGLEKVVKNGELVKLLGKSMELCPADIGLKNIRNNCPIIDKQCTQCWKEALEAEIIENIEIPNHFRCKSGGRSLIFTKTDDDYYSVTSINFADKEYVCYRTKKDTLQKRLNNKELKIYKIYNYKSI